MSYIVTIKDISQMISYNGSIIIPTFFLFAFLVAVFFTVNKKHIRNLIVNIATSGFLALSLSSLLAFGMVHSTLGNGYYYKNDVVHILYGKNDYRLNSIDIKSIEIVKPKPFASGWMKDARNTDVRIIDTVLRINGNSTGNVKAGIFKLNTGERAKVFLYLPCEEALLIHTKNDEVYYIGTPNIMDLYKVLQGQLQ